MMALKNILKYFCADMPISVHVLMKVWYTAETSAILPLPLNRLFLRSTVKGRMFLSAILLSMVYRHPAGKRKAAASSCEDS